ncbi:CCA tRNA nucleotidyltransferase [Candidatus Daviesbacteria bacterium]|nr:CCA tRNA nucleotidyltransferase [Candidatus Daviesbacteria bacterium]
MKYNLPDQVKVILENLEKSGYQAFVVGGAVRDLLMGREIHDWDFTTDAKPDEILKLFPNAFYTNKFGTVGLPSDLGIIEITTMRKEGVYRDLRHPDQVSWTQDINQDLARRDFTINAIALGKGKALSVKSEDLTLIDPFHGQNDIKDKLIRAVGDPNVRFQEDALRLMRAIRIATQLNFEVDQNTFDAIKQNADLIKKVSWERIRDELFKILESKNSYEGILSLRESGILKKILPELERCFGIVQEGPKHDREYDIGEHSLLSLKHTPSPNPLVRFAALIHDIGKPDTVFVQKDGNVTFYGHDVVGGKIAQQIAHRFKLSKKQVEKLVALVRWHLFTVDVNQTDSAVRRFIKNVGVENIDDMMAVRVGDRLGGGTQNAVSWRMKEFRNRIDEVLKKPFTVADLKINGNDVMKELNIKPGPKVGEILNTLFQEVLEDSSKNNREYLLERMKKI